MLHRHELVEVVCFERPGVNDLAPVCIDDSYELALLNTHCFALSSRNLHLIAGCPHISTLWAGERPRASLQVIAVSQAQEQLMVSLLQCCRVDAVRTRAQTHNRRGSASVNQSPCTAVQCPVGARLLQVLTKITQRDYTHD